MRGSGKGKGVGQGQAVAIICHRTALMTQNEYYATEEASGASWDLVMPYHLKVAPNGRVVCWRNSEGGSGWPTAATC